MRRDADLAELGHQVFGDAVVEHALAGDRALLLVVEGAGVVFEILHQGARLRSFEQDLGLALINATTARHPILQQPIGSPWRPWRVRRESRFRPPSSRCAPRKQCRQAAPLSVAEPEIALLFQSVT